VASTPSATPRWSRPRPVNWIVLWTSSLTARCGMFTRPMRSSGGGGREEDSVEALNVARGSGKEKLGTVARMRVKHGMSDELLEMIRPEEERLAGSGFVATHLYRMDSDPDEYYMAVILDCKEAYVRNAESAEQNASHQRMIEFREADPEWHDGEVVYRISWSLTVPPAPDGI